MARYLAPLVLSFAAAPNVIGAPLQPRQGACQDIFFQVEAQATNQQVLVQPDLSSLESALAFSNQPNQPHVVCGNETIYGRFCKAPAADARATAESQTLQILVHGNTYDSRAWHGFGAAYSWEADALARGYHTLAIDRLGAGRSSHPDPLTHVQGPYQVELLHKVIQQLRTRDTAPNNYKHLVWVGHSYGSILATNLAAKYPTDMDAYVLTGLAAPKAGDNPAPGQLQMAFVPAAAFDPARFPPRQFPPGYLVTANKAGRAASFYGAPGAYDAGVFDADFAGQSTLAAGEVLTQAAATAPRFGGPVFVLTGQNDAIMCGNGTRAPPEKERPDCGSGAGSQLAAVRTLFPAAQRFDFYAQPDAGHVQMNHYSAKDGFQKAHDFLASWLDGKAAP